MLADAFAAVLPEALGDLQHVLLEDEAGGFGVGRDLQGSPFVEADHDPAGEQVAADRLLTGDPGEVTDAEDEFVGLAQVHRLLVDPVGLFVELGVAADRAFVFGPLRPERGPDGVGGADALLVGVFGEGDRLPVLRLPAPVSPVSSGSPSSLVSPLPVAGTETGAGATSRASVPPPRRASSGSSSRAGGSSLRWSRRSPGWIHSSRTSGRAGGSMRLTRSTRNHWSESSGSSNPEITPGVSSGRSPSHRILVALSRVRTGLVRSSSESTRNWNRCLTPSGAGFGSGATKVFGGSLLVGGGRGRIPIGVLCSLGAGEQGVRDQGPPWARSAPTG